MGKYIRKSKTTSEVAVMDLSFGVRTRAKTLALQRQRQATLPASSSPPSPPTSTSGYLQLRSRRLVKKPPILLHVSKRQKHGHNNKVGINPNNNDNANSNSNSSKSGSRVRVSSGSVQKKEVDIEIREGEEGKNKSSDDGDNNNNSHESKDLGIEEASFGENVLDIEGRERGTRESTPCSLIRDPESVKTPVSTTRPSSTETNRRVQSSMRRHIPTTHEMEDFFTGAEEQQQRRFIEKYNFDPVNDKPLPGRYEWEKLDP